jgi:hypothetical protein
LFEPFNKERNCKYVGRIYQSAADKETEWIAAQRKKIDADA